MPTGIYIRTEEHKKNISSSCMGRIMSQETRKKLSTANKGKKLNFVPKRAFKKGYIPWNKGTKGLCKTNSGSFKSGQRAYNYIDGRTPLVKRIREFAIGKKWRLKILELDDYTCVKCGKRGGYLEVHHYISFSDIFNDFIKIYSHLDIKNDVDELYKYATEFDRFWNIHNGLTLCKECHNITKKNGGELWTC